MPPNSFYERVSPFEVGRKRKKLKLYMYVNADALFKIIDSQLLRLSKPWLTNDITECIFQYENDLRFFVKNYAYLCFSSVRDSAAMWGYYAERGKGACLEFEFDVVEVAAGVYEILFGGMMSVENPVYIRKVAYGPKRAVRGNLLDLFFVKSQEWEHENEYRIVFNLAGKSIVTKNENGNIANYVSGFLDSLTGVILGPRTSYESTEVYSYLKCWCSGKESVRYGIANFYTSILHSYRFVSVSRAKLSRVKFQLKIYSEKRGVLPSNDGLECRRPDDLFFLFPPISETKIISPMVANGLNRIGISGAGRVGYQYEVEGDNGEKLTYLLWKMESVEKKNYMLLRKEKSNYLFVMRSIHEQERLAALYESSAQQVRTP